LRNIKPAERSLGFKITLNLFPVKQKMNVFRKKVDYQNNSIITESYAMKYSK